jgi:hypothetical protein
LNETFCFLGIQQVSAIYWLIFLLYRYPTPKFVSAAASTTGTYCILYHSIFFHSTNYPSYNSLHFSLPWDPNLSLIVFMVCITLSHHLLSFFITQLFTKYLFLAFNLLMYSLGMSRNYCVVVNVWYLKGLFLQFKIS